jgi:dGTPase
LQALVGRAKKTIETIFFRLLGRPELMPLRYQEMLLTERRERVVADYIAGMTDRYAESTLQKIGG